MTVSLLFSFFIVDEEGGGGGRGEKILGRVKEEGGGKFTYLCAEPEREGGEAEAGAGEEGGRGEVER